MEELDEHVDQAADIFTTIKDTGYDVVMNHGPRVLMVIVLLVVGLWIIKRIESGLRKIMTRRNLDPSLIPFVVTMLDISLKVLLIISLAGVLGFPTTSFVAILGAAGLAVGLALQGTLANFAGGVLILIFKPFRVGDLIEAQGEKGNVKEIQIFVTIINTPENKTVIIPNGAISNGNITNYTVEGVIRVDMTFGVSYDSDIKKTKEVLLKTVLKDSTFIYKSYTPDSTDKIILRSAYTNQLYGFWLGQSIANWTGLVTEMDKIGNIGEIRTGNFYTRDDWGKPDQPSIWGAGIPSDLSPTIDFVFRDTNEIWGADDDTDIEYMYQHLMFINQTSFLTPVQIRDGWLKHIKQNEENYLWVSNQKAYDLMLEGVLPPETGNPEKNEHHEMIDAQLTTEIFGLFSPARSDVATRIAHLPIQTTAREESEDISRFYVTMYSLASFLKEELPMKDKINWMSFD